MNVSDVVVPAGKPEARLPDPRSGALPAQARDVHRLASTERITSTAAR